MKSYAEWQAMAASQTFHKDAFIDGRFVPARNGNTFDSINPATEQCLSTVAACDEADVNAAVSAARAAFESGCWSELAPAERKRILLRLADLIEANRDEFALLDTLDMGKSISEMVAIDVPDSIDCFRWTAECIDKIYGEIAPTAPGSLALISREPIGVIGAITPWNYPLMMISWKIAPALAAGNCVILKPSEKAPLSALRLAELASEAGLPDGVLNVLPGFGESAGKALALHNDVDVLTFTGSTRTAGLLMQYAGQSNMKQVWIEAGGKSPNLVFADCADLQRAADISARAIFTNQGQVCIACSRIYVEESIREPFIQALLKATEQFRPGDPLDPQTTLGPMVDATQLATVGRYVQYALDEGGRVLTGGKPDYEQGQGYFVEPTIIDNAHNGMTFVREEIFGPVLAVCTFKDEDEAIALANDSKYGLGAAIWTDNLSRAHRVSRKIRSGMVWINTWGDGDTTVPFGGVKASGNSRDKSTHSLEKYSNTKYVWLQL
ncbi:aldehyde dehydrogenase [Granulosicoccaceae sp. 1_MG-2023]|nr:aldehyde dehydrogenase [Granulosicoccaceae sp. 1_MG-2023]